MLDVKRQHPHSGAERGAAAGWGVGFGRGAGWFCASLSDSEESAFGFAHARPEGAAGADY